MPRAPTTPRLPLPNTRHERVAQLLAAGKDEEGNVLDAARAYLLAGYECNPATARMSCHDLLQRRSNGVQARIDYLLDQSAKELVRDEIEARKRRLQKNEARYDEVDGMLDHIYALATEMRPKLTPRGELIINPLTGEPILEPGNWPAAMKVVELLGTDAGRFIKQSKHGKIDEEYGNLNDPALLKKLEGALAQHGYELKLKPLSLVEETPPEENEDSPASESAP